MERKEKIKEQQAADKKLKEYKDKNQKLTSSEYQALLKQVDDLKKEKENLEALYF